MRRIWAIFKGSLPLLEQKNSFDPVWKRNPTIQNYSYPISSSSLISVPDPPIVIINTLLYK